MKTTESIDSKQLLELLGMRNQAAPAWLQTFQRDALTQFEQAGFPTTRQEDWKYTDVRKLAAIYPEWLAHSPQPAPDPELALDIPDAIRLIFQDGQFNEDLSSNDIPSEILVGSHAELISRAPELLQDRLGQLAPASDSGFIALNAAFGENITVIAVPDNTRLERPVCIEYFASTAATTSQPRLVLQMGANSSATVIEHFYGTDQTITNAVCEANLGPSANLTYYRLQEEHPEAWHTAVQYFQLDRAASVETVCIEAGAQLVRSDQRIILAGAEAFADAKGLLLADGNRHVDTHFTIEHAAPHTQSRERFRSILADNARGVFNGRILVQQNAQKTAAELTNRNLLLSKGAEINTKPELEIYADDVKCAHGATTGQLDATSLFYLLSRGIEPAVARNILVRAFASELLTTIKIPAVAERAQDAMAALRLKEL